MKFSVLMEKAVARGVKIVSMRAGGEGGAEGGAGAGDPEIRGVCEDSRKARPGDLFVARSGTKASGAAFIADAIARGAVAVVVGHAVQSGKGEGKKESQRTQRNAEVDSVNSVSSVVGSKAAYTEVENANLACAVLAHEVAGNPTGAMKMIGITGTKGKTTVAYLMRSVLKAAGHKVGMIGTVEIDDGKTVVSAEMTTPGAVELVEMFSRMRDHGVTHCVMEVSSHALHQHRVAGIDFAVAIFTNLTGDHLDYHKTMEEYAAAKAMLFEGLKEGAVAVVNADDPYADAMVLRCAARIVRFHVEMGLEKSGLLVVQRPTDGWSGLVVRMGSEGMQVNLSGPDANRDGKVFMYKFQTPLTGRHNAYNLTGAVAATFALNMPDALFMKGMRSLEKAIGAPGRLQPVTPEGTLRASLPFQTFVDYAHTHDALENVLSALRATMNPRQTANPSRDRQGATELSARSNRSLPDGRGSDTSPRLICLFGCGGDRDRTKRPKMAAVAEKLADKVIVTSDNPRTENPQAIIEEICAGFSAGWKENEKISVEPDRRAAIRLAIGMAKRDDVVLLAGKGHENYQIIGTIKHHFDDVEEAQAALRERHLKHQDAQARK